MRLSAQGSVYTCLFSEKGTSFRELIRSGVSDELLKAAVMNLWKVRNDNYSEQRSEGVSHAKIEMSYIGG